ncbi:cystathionine-beta-synthase domain-containing protein [Cavenderia fasciculata]|uniref:Cystathionine-beta-synthase domain-containing protein n=1 Tax=Cavenderia fasciculata TaxID=261658 RepID=F4PJP8_CACFS|nr:cystathionine-beta-synthase domain-containing protein [Cavenderia fasciculata]EGG23822.1 cystathionine-beta-synthase domain-containing protein [Cavenderia fasciculata]|eukprot:XP_004361673.1 cystathionine-beta-synthase domain-containing protein [Cavenderia fasciculata]
MWYTDEDEETAEIIDNIEKEETKIIKQKAFHHSHHQQVLNLMNNNNNQQDSNSDININNNNNTTFVNNNNNNSNDNKMDRNNKSLNDSDNNVIRSSSGSSPSPSPSPMASSSDTMFVIEELPESSSGGATTTAINLQLPKFVDTAAPTLHLSPIPKKKMINDDDEEEVEVEPNILPSSSNRDTPNLISGLRSINESKDDIPEPTTPITPQTPSSLSTSKDNNNNNNINIVNLNNNNNGNNQFTFIHSPPDLSTMTQHQHNIYVGKLVFSQFLNKHTCYDVIPISGKVVVLDTKLVVKSAFYALEENGIKSAPLWSPDLQDFTGMITVSDFIDILLYYYNKPKSDNIFQDMGIHRIETFWREINVERPKTLIYTEPETNLFEAASLLLKYKIHRLPVVDKKETNSILHILTHSRILAFMMKSLPDLPSGLLSCTLGSLGIGTFENVCTVSVDTPLVQVLKLLSEKKISAVPILDESDKVVDVYSKGDVTLMAKQGILSPSDLDKPVHQVLSTFSRLWQRPEQVYSCTKNDKLGDVIEKCIKKRVHRLIVVAIDSSKKVEGILSLSDILNFLLNLNKY